MFEVVEETIGGVTNRVFKIAPDTLGQLFAATRESDAEFIIYEDERWTFRKLMEHVDAFAAALVNDYGIKKGDRVGISMRNLPEWVISFAAIISIGGISVSLNAWWTQEELDYAIGDSELSLLIVDAERLDRAHKPAHERNVPIIVVRSDELDPVVGNVARYESVVTTQQPFFTLLERQGFQRELFLRTAQSHKHSLGFGLVSRWPISEKETTHSALLATHRVLF